MAMEIKRKESTDLDDLESMIKNVLNIWVEKVYSNIYL